MISNIRHVLNVLFFLLGDSPASEFYVPTFRNTVPPSFLLIPPVKTEQTDYSETSAHEIQTPGNRPKGRIQQLLFSFISLTDTFFRRFLRNKKQHICGHHVRPSDSVPATKLFIGFSQNLQNLLTGINKLEFLLSTFTVLFRWNSVQYLHIKLLSVGEFHENLRIENNSFLMGLIEIAFMRVYIQLYNSVRRTTRWSELRSSRVLRSEYWWFLTDVSGQTIGPIFQGLWRLYRNVGKESPVLAA